MNILRLRGPVFAAATGLLHLQAAPALGTRAGREPPSPELQAKIESLATIEPKRAIRLYHGIYNGLWHVPIEQRRPDLIDEAEHCLARNRRLPSYIRNLLQETPQLIENRHTRYWPVNAVGRLKAEWAVRLLGELLLDDRELDTEEYTSEWAVRVYIEGGGQLYYNRGGASQALQAMKLPSLERARESGESVKDWWLANKDRVEEIVVEAWGDEALLNRDLGLDSNNNPLPKVVRPKREAPSRPRQVAPDGSSLATEPGPSISTAQWIISLLALLAAGVGVWIIIRRKGSRSDDTR